MPPKVREVVERLRDEGWQYIGTTGSHHHYEHPTKGGKVTVPGKPSDVLRPGTWNSIQRQAGWRR